MTTSTDIDHALDEGQFDALEALLVSEDVPADCMNLEMLDGYLAAIACAPGPIPPERWMPGVWSADEEAVSFGSGSSAQQAIALVLGYHNEVVTTLLAEEGWEPFCYAPDEADDDAPSIGDEWAAGFDQGLECWPEDWAEGLTEEQAAAIQERLETILAPWEAEDAGLADDETRVGWLRDAAGQVRAVAAEWIALGRPGAAPVEVPDTAAAAAGGPGRNDLCPCGSGKKYKKCCGAAV
jgi:uncharacterized protein